MIGLGWLFRLVYPPKCVLCRQVLPSAQMDLCHHCREQVPEYPKGKKKRQFLDSWTAVWYYEGSVRSSVLRYKFSRARHYAKSYGRLLAMKIQKDYPDGFDILTWVPVSRIRKFTRGYDQVALLARAVGRELGVKPVPLLKKIRHNPPQSGIHGYSRRRANVLGVYRCRNEKMTEKKRILLLDDIITTGATAGECARVLLTAGASEVHCAVLAAVRDTK